MINLMISVANVVSKIVERCEETRVEGRSQRGTFGDFLFKGSPIEIDFVDDFCLPLKEKLVLVHSKISSISDPGIQSRKDRRV